MNKPTKEECRLAANEDQKSFQRLSACEQKLLEKYHVHAQYLHGSGLWGEHYDPRSCVFIPGLIYRLNPAAAATEGPSDEELELCRNPLARVLAVMPECVETLKKWPMHVQYMNPIGTWVYDGSTTFVGNRASAYRLVRESCRK